MKKILHLLKTESDHVQRMLMNNLSEGSDSLEIPLFGADGDDNVDYDEIVDLIFEYDQVITWW